MVGIDRILHLLIYLAAAVSLLPVLPFLDWWVQLALAVALGSGMIGDRYGRYLLGKLPATMISFGFFFLFLLQVSLVNLVEPLIQLLCLLLAVRLASDKSPRHMLQLFMLSTIVLAASSLLTLDIVYLLYLIVLVLLVTSGLVLLSFYATDARIRLSRRDWRVLLKTLLLLPVGSLLLMLVLFVILPRTQTPLWNFLNPRPTAVVGMADQISPGSVSTLSQSGQLAFRAETARLPAEELYWRGIVLNLLHGQTWERSRDVPDEKYLPGTMPERQLKIYTEPKAAAYLVTLDHPHRIELVRHRISADAVVRGRFSSGQKLNYLVFAQPDAHSKLLGKADQYLQLPDNLEPRLVAVGRDIGQQGKNFQDKMKRLETFFRRQQLSYSSQQLLLTAHPVETFLFDTKRGYCEYFASSFALLLRLAGVPARLVGGYLGGDYNQLGGYYLVSEDLAHVWVEALDDQGVWQRIDPSRLAVNAEQELLQPRQRGLASMQILADALLYNWNRLVLSYDLRQQFELVRNLGRRVRDLKQVRLPSPRALLWGGLLLVPFALHYLRRRFRTRELRLVRNYRRRLASCCGIDELPVELGLFELARRTGARPCQEFARIYGGAFYRDKALSTAEYRHLRALNRSLKGQQYSIEVAKPSADGDNMKSMQPS